MTRSNNSRKGHYSCHCRISWDRVSYETKWKGKHNKKRNIFKFYNLIGRAEIGKKRYYVNRFSTWIYDTYVAPAKKSYFTWSWLKGKPNRKGMNHKILSSGFKPKAWY